MTFRANVQGGTGAGSKRPLADQHQPWICSDCLRTNQGFVVRCLTPGCNKPRP